MGPSIALSCLPAMQASGVSLFKNEIHTLVVMDSSHPIAGTGGEGASEPKRSIGASRGGAVCEVLAGAVL